jgi:hypothetical protein
MAEHEVDITAGLGTSIKTDQVAGKEVQYIKIMDGTPDSNEKITGDAANGLDVDVTRLPITQPLTDAELRADPIDVSLVEDFSGDQHIQIAGTENIPFSQNPSTLEQFVQDTNLMNVLGSQSLINQGRMKVEFKPITPDQISNVIYGTNRIVMYDVAGYSTAAVQISGTWAGTITFEGTLDNTNWVNIPGLPALISSTLAGIATANQIIRFNIIGLQRFQVRFSSYTSGQATVTVLLSTSAINQQITIDGNGYEYTRDIWLAAANSPIIKPIVSAPSVRAVQSTYTDTKFSGLPDIQPRIRVEIGGDQQVPFSQVPGSYEQKVIDLPLYRIMEEILAQLMILNQQTLMSNDAAGIKSNPNILTEIR